MLWSAHDSIHVRSGATDATTSPPRLLKMDAEEVRIEMPREYSDHPFCKELMTLRDEESLQDVAVSFGASGRVERMSGFLLCLLSPVWRARLCGEFSHGRARGFELEEDEAEAMKTLVELGCGGGGGRVIMRGLEELLEVGRLAERYQVDEVRRAVEEEAVKYLKLERCMELQTVSEHSGLRRVEEACRRMALKQFEELTSMEGFMGMGEETLGSLLKDDRLECGSEEAVFEGLVRWMQGGSDGRVGELRGEGLLDLIRFPMMRVDYLRTSARRALAGSERLERLVSEALAVKGLAFEERSKHIKLFGVKALRERAGRGVRWEEYGEGRREARRLPASSGDIFSLAECGDWVCGGLDGGKIMVCNKASLEVERTLTGHRSSVRTLAVCKSWLLSGSDDKTIRVWDVRVGQCLRTLEGHTDIVRILAVSESMLLSNSDDKTMKVWRVTGAPSTWRCQRTLSVPTWRCEGRQIDVEDSCQCLAWWGGEAVSGSVSGNIRVWDVSAGESVRMLQGHTRVVTAMVVMEGRLISASTDRSLREWCLESGACVKIVDVSAVVTLKCISCLTISGRKLVGGSCQWIVGFPSDCEVVVWDLDTLVVLHSLKQPGRQNVRSLVAMEGEVWGGVGKQLAVWGREGD